MNALYSTLAKNILNSTAFAEQGLDPIQHIDLFFNQYNNPEQEETFDVPALFIELSLQADERFRKPTTSVVITTHLIVQKLTPTAITQLQKTTPTLDIYNYRTIIKQIITQTQNTTFSKINYIETQALEQAGPLLILKEKFNATLYEPINTDTTMQQAPITQTPYIKTTNRSIV